MKLVTLPDGNTRQMDYTGCGCAGSNETKVTDELGHYTETKNDARGRLIEATEPNPSSAQNIYSRATYIYDDLDRLIEIQHTAHPASPTPMQNRYFTYDGYGRMVSETTPEGGTVTYTYTANDQVWQVSNQRSITVANTYITRGLVTNVSYSDSTPAVTYSYDAYGARSAMTDGQGSTSYTYNSYRQLQSESRTFTGLNSKTYKLNYTYNQGDQVTRVNYYGESVEKDENEELQTTVLINKNINYAYNAVGALGGIGTNLIGTDANNTTNVLNTVTFRASGALKQLNYGNGRRLTMGYDDNRNQPTSMVVDRTNNSSDKVVDYAYQYYDANGKNNNRIRQITDNIDTAYTTGYLYDDYNRLTSATASAFSRSYGYDPFGNITNFNGVTLNYATNSSGAPATNRLSTDSASNSYTYDAAGNMTAGAGQSYSYDGANRLKEVGSGGANVYGYDGDGKRVKKTEGGATVFYVYSSKLGQSVMEVTASSIQRAYVYSKNKMVAMQGTDGQFYWLHTDHLNNSRAMTDANGNLAYKGHFDPYGQALTEWSSSGNTNLNSKKFTGYERDSATGLDYADKRMYNSGQGRLTTPDPFGLKASNSKRPESLNRYAYVENDPVNFLDSTGTNKAFVECYLWIDWTLWDNGSITINFMTMFCTGSGSYGSGSGDGSGQGSGIQRPQIDSENDLRQGFKEFLMSNMSNECREALADFMPMINSMAVGGNLIDVDKYGSMPASSFISLETMGKNGIPLTATLRQALDITQPSVTGAWSIWGGIQPVAGIYFRGSSVAFSSGDPNDRGMYLMLHEMTHMAAQETDQELVKKFNITLKDGENASAGLSRFFNSECKER